MHIYQTRALSWHNSCLTSPFLFLIFSLIVNRSSRPSLDPFKVISQLHSLKTKPDFTRKTTPSGDENTIHHIQLTTSILQSCGELTHTCVKSTSSCFSVLLHIYKVPHLAVKMKVRCGAHRWRRCLVPSRRWAEKQFLGRNVATVPRPERRSPSAGGRKNEETNSLHK